jgi:phosphate-selective porin OprO/OprP
MYLLSPSGPVRRVLAGAVLAWAGAAYAVDPVNPPPEVALSEVEALRQQIDALNKQLGNLEQRLTTQEQADAAQKETVEKIQEEQSKAPVVTADGKGFRIASRDKKFELRIGGRVAYDVGWFHQDDELKDYVGDEQDGTAFRYARIRLQARIYENLFTNFEIDFAGENGADAPKFRDLFIEYQNIPYGGDRAFDFRVGHFREPFSLEELTAVTARTFNERSLGNGFVPGRNAGIQVSDAWLGEKGAERLTAQFGVFKETDDLPSSNDSDEDQGYILTGRVTGLPWYANEGKRYLHLGAAYSRRNPDGAGTAYGSIRPESRLAQFRYANATNLPVGFRLQDARADDVNLFGAEAAFVIDRFSVQGEYIHSNIKSTFGGDLNFGSYYVQASVFLTDDYRPYRNKEGILDYPKVKNPVKFTKLAEGEKRGWGAWELSTRWSSVDLNDGPIRGGKHSAATAGLSWYLNSQTRITTNYTYNIVEHDRYDGDFGFLQTRFQVDF